ncbi:polyprenyl synthetase family protein [Plastoroseomonas hellenica]|uniref:Polyprenyl synthetase family protein n=1 Tax=Plastoroseomonas hellenica TaxID=2687306 RepID=A0ABS5ETV9_9PROT|nr:polyprenyl synthetase family protein [Plastoroseomonas hellenica]MBR0663727.1 polyprenyl synthetase family protein [Plastoroseomonas hellenica]
MTDLAAALAEAAAEIDAALDRVIPQSEGDESRLFEAMRYAAIGGGKRLRGFLVLEGAKQFGVGRSAALRAAAAVEMLHAYSLVHDDLPAMDDDDLRRGKPTVHIAFDEATAVLAGDALQANAFYVLSHEETHADPAVRAELCHCLARAAGPRGMCGGQMLDMLAEQATAPLEESAIGRLQLLKTGKLIEFAAEAGAILGKAPPTLRHALSAYGRDLGAAFQIADDLLDLTATPEQAGKATGKDAAAGKATLLGLLGPERAKLQAERLAQQAAHHLDSFGERADLLRALATYAIERRN